MKEKMMEDVARSICQAANDPRNYGCPHCEDDPAKCMWDTFTNEAEAALTTVRKYALVQLRNKPRKD